MNSLKIIYQDPQCVVLEKESGLLSIPGKGVDKQDSVSSRLRTIFPECIKQPSVHRLDMDTSGLMVYALTSEAHRNLSIQFQDRLVEKKYVSILDGDVSKDSGEIRLPTRVDIYNRPYQIYDPVHGKSGTTCWRKLAVEEGRARIEYNPLTGRTHQLRIHSAHRFGLGCSIAGDRLYGNPDSANRLMLHASFLAFKHPESGKIMKYKSPVPF